jgi:hypothetical protein
MANFPVRHDFATPTAVPSRSTSNGWLTKLRVLCATVVAAGLTWLSHPATAASPAAGAAPANCLNQIASGSSPEVICSFPTALGERERAELRRMTGDLFVDARCLVHVRIERRQIAAVLIKPDHVFQASPQQVTCELISSSERLPVRATFAPRIVIRDGRAVDAHPGMADLTGINELVADPVLQYINQSETIRRQMVGMVNMYIANKKIGEQAFGGRG